MQRSDKGCFNCNDGWVVHLRTTGPHKGCPIHIPCLCHRGHHWMEKDFKNMDFNKLDKEAERAIADNRAREKAQIEAGRALLDDGVKTLAPVGRPVGKGWDSEEDGQCPF